MKLVTIPGRKTCQLKPGQYDMAMSLTRDDLQAVKQLIDSSIDERVPKIIDERVPAIIDERVQPMLDKLEDRTFKRLSRLEHRLNVRIDETNETLAQQVAAGFEEVHSKFEGVHDKFEGVHDKIDNLSVQMHDIGQTVERIEQSQRRQNKRDKLRTSK
jgi:hypothetical protein